MGASGEKMKKSSGVKWVNDTALQAGTGRKDHERADGDSRIPAAGDHRIPAAVDNQIPAADDDRERAAGDDRIPATSDDRERAARLLLMLSRVEFTDEEKERIREECASFGGWKLFTDMSIRHGVAALVWQNFSDLSLEGHMPEPERAILEGLRFKSIARVTYITGIAATAVAALEKEGIRVLLLKGLALEHTVYGSRGLRQMSDADLLVEQHDALRARDILISAGFKSRPLKSWLYKYIILDLGNHLPELHRGGMSVDLHYRLFGPEGGEMVSRAIGEADEITAGGNTFHVLPPQTAFLALVSHIYKHRIKGEFQLRLYADIYLLLKKHPGILNSESLAAAAQQAGISGEVRVVLSVMEQAWGLTVPAGMRALPGEEKMRVARFMNDLMYPNLVRPESQYEMFRRNLGSLKGYRKKLVFITGDIFPSVEFMRHRYRCRSGLSAMLYYPHRLGKLYWVLGLSKAKKRDK